MRFDIFGGLVGKARRREIEGAVAVNLTPLAKRLGLGLAAAAAAAAVRPDLVTTRTGLATLGVTALAGMIPAGALPAGILTRSAPDRPSLVEGAARTAAAVLDAPAAQHQAAIQAAVSEELRAYGPELISLAVQQINKTNMTGFRPDELGKKDDTPAKVSEALPSPQDAAAIAVTGGNQ